MNRFPPFFSPNFFQCFFLRFERMNFRTLSFLSITTLSLLTVVAIHAETVFVSNASSFVHVFESADEESMGKDVVLENDINFDGMKIVPFGLNISTGKCTPYHGTLQGNGYVLKGLVIDQTGNTLYGHSGLFCGLDGALIENVTFDESCKMTGTDSGALSVSVTGSVTLRNVKSQSTLLGTGNVGGLISRIESSPGSTVIFDHCIVEGDISNTKGHTGGFVGVFTSSYVTVTFKDCENGCTLNLQRVGGSVGGFVGFIGGNLFIVLNIKNCTSRGSLNAQSDAGADVFAGGLIGIIKSCDSSVVFIDQVFSSCTTKTQKEKWSVYVGGLLGFVQNCKGLNATIRQSISKGQLSVSFFNGYGSYTGGFIGCINGNSDTSIQFRDCSSVSDIYLSNPTNYSYTSGFIGRFSHNSNSVTTVEHCTNKGRYTFSGNFASESYVGGFSGEVYNNKYSNFLINNATNKANAQIETNNYWSRLCGLIGNVAAEKDQNFKLEVNNSANYGNFSSGGGSSFGLYWTNEKNNEGVTSYVYNSINKGTLTGNYAFGITNIATSLKNVVSMGILTGTSSCQIFANSITPISSYFLDTACNSPTNGIQFRKGSDGLYYTTNDNKQVDEELNYNSTNEQYGMIWDTELNLINAIRVNFGSPINKLAYVKPGDNFKMACDIIKKPIDDFISVNRKTWNIFVDENIIEEDLDVALCFNLTVSGVLNKINYVEYETLFSKIEILKPYLNEKYGLIDTDSNTTIYDENTIMNKHMSIIVVQKMAVSIGRPVNKTTYVINGTTLNDAFNTLNITFESFKIVDRKTWTEIDNNTKIDKDTDIALCHGLTLSGLKKSTLLIEHGVPFSEIDILEPYLNEKYALIDSNNYTIVYNLNTTIVEDMEVMVKKLNILETEFEFEEKGGDVDIDQVKKDIEDLMKDKGKIVTDVTVKEKEDNRLVILVTVVEEDTDDAADALLSCSKQK